MAAGEQHMAAEPGGLAIICGAGPLPFAVADACRQRGRSVFLLGLRGWADPQAITRYPHDWIGVGNLGRICKLARGAGCADVVCIGTLVRPSFRALRLDWATITVLPQLYRLFRGGDDHLLSGLTRILEERGFRLLGAHEVAPEILAVEGPLGKLAPSRRDLADAERGFALLDAISDFDVGQAAVVADMRVLAIEAAEGTDHMLERIAELRRIGRIQMPIGSGVLLKAPKRDQDRRMDLPAIGPATVEGVRHAGLAGIAVRAGEVIIVEPAAVTEAADRAGLFVVGTAAKSNRPT